MDTVTYPDPKTVHFLNETLIPVRVNVSSQSDTAMEYQIKYTPTVVIVDGDGKEHYRAVGFLRSPEFIPAMLLGMARAQFNNERFQKSHECLARILTEYPASQVAGEAGLLKIACAKKLRS